MAYEIGCQIVVSDSDRYPDYLARTKQYTTHDESNKNSIWLHGTIFGLTQFGFTRKRVKTNCAVR